MDHNEVLFTLKKEMAFEDAWKNTVDIPPPHKHEIKSIIKACKTINDAKYLGVQHAKAFQLDFNEGQVEA